jgi:DNA-binding transcriptional MerR regulator
MSIKRRTAEHRLARLTGISGHTVRYYVTEGLLNLSRLNSRTERELAMRIKFITVLREIGLPLGYIAELIQYRMASSQQKEPIAQYLAARLQYVDSQARRAAAEKRRLAKASEEFRRIAADDDVTTVEFFRRLRSAARHLSDCGETKQRTPRTRTAKDRIAKAQYGSPRKPE